MRTYRSMWALLGAGLMCWAAGCAPQSDCDAMARANLQMQDKLSASQAERVKARTQVAMLRQEVLQARQAQQEVQDRLDAMSQQVETLRAKVDVQAEVISRSQKAAPQTQVTVSLSPETLDKLIQRVQGLTEQVGDLRARNNKMEYQLKIQAAGQEVSTLTAQAAKMKTGTPRPAPATAPAAGTAQPIVNAVPMSTQPTR